MRPMQTADAPTSNRKLPIIIGIFAVLALVIAGGIWAVKSNRLGEKAASMTYLSMDNPGQDAFMKSIVSPEAEPIIDQFAQPSASENNTGNSPAGAVKGTDPNLYGGTGSIATCDAETLAQNLEGNAELKAAFASGIGINADDVREYILALTPLTLMQDTWVTNHGFRDGKATPFQAVLQKGTAVLVDAHGVPRVRCSCGNPLAEAWEGYTAPSDKKVDWEGYAPKKVVAVYGAKEPATTLSIRDLEADAEDNRAFTENQLTTQTNVMDAVTEQTPRTTPKDMEGGPDEELLKSLGMTPTTGDGNTRPTGGERFDEYNDAMSGGSAGVVSEGNREGDEIDAVGAYPDWESQTTEVDADEFITYQRGGKKTYGVLFEGRNSYCIVKTEGNWVPTVICPLDELKNSGLKDVSSGSGPSAIVTDLSQMSMSPGSGGSGFVPGGSLESGGFHPVTGDMPPKLAEGQSVRIGDFACFHVSEGIGCEYLKYHFLEVKGEGVFDDSSKEPIGKRCGRWGNGGSLGGEVAIAEGSVDCKTAQEIAQKYWDAPAGIEFGRAKIYPDLDGWSCSMVSSSIESQKVGRTGQCVRYGDENATVALLN